MDGAVSSSTVHFSPYTPSRIAFTLSASARGRYRIWYGDGPLDNQADIAKQGATGSAAGKVSVKIRYEVVLDEPLEIDSDWPLTLPDGGLFRVKTEAGKVNAFEVEYSGKPSDYFGSRKDGVLSVNDKRWTRMRYFFAHLKGFIQLESEANFEPTEVFAHYDSENEVEKKEIRVQKMVIEKGEDRRVRRPLDHELLGAAVRASYFGGVGLPPFVGELKSMSRRSKREGRYADSFRYSFLIVDTLYGKGQFKTNQIVKALSSNEEFVNALNVARYKFVYLAENARDETERLLARDCPIEDLIRHIVKQRGVYFHGTNELKRTGDWGNVEARKLCELMSRTTDEICRVRLTPIFGDSQWNWYQRNAARSGTLVDVVVEFRVHMRSSGDTIIVRKQPKLVGTSHSLRVRLKWALEAIENAEELRSDIEEAQAVEKGPISDDDLELESVIGKEEKSDQELFSIRMITTKTRLNGTLAGGGWDDVRDPSDTYDMKWYFHEAAESRILGVLGQSEAASFWYSGPEARKWVRYSIREGLEFDHVGLYRIVCQGAAASAPLFEVGLGDLGRGLISS